MACKGAPLIAAFAPEKQVMRKSISGGRKIHILLF
jgi:hypothetical protein